MQQHTHTGRHLDVAQRKLSHIQQLLALSLQTGDDGRSQAAGHVTSLTHHRLDLKLRRLVDEGKRSVIAFDM